MELQFLQAVIAYIPPIPVLVLLLIVVLYLAQYFKTAPDRLPPGPPTWPIIGNMAHLNPKRPHKTCTEWAKKYGPVYRLYFGKELVVMLNDFESIKEAYGGKHGEAFSGRPDLVIMNEFGGGRHGLVCSDGEQWKEQRRFTVSVLRDFGFGRSVMEQKIRLEVDRMMEQLDVLASIDKTIDKSVDQQSIGIDASLPIKLCTANVITSIILGHSFAVGDAEFMEYQRRVHDLIQVALRAQPVNYFPILQHIVPGGMGIHTFRENIQYIRNRFLKPQIQQHLNNLPENAADATDLTSAYLLKMKSLGALNPIDTNHNNNCSINTQDNEKKKHWFSLQELESVINDLFIAGLDTTVTTMNWFILYLLHNPEVQKKIHEELDASFSDELPSWSERNRLPYLAATIMETQRLGNILPLGVFHSTTEEVEFRDYVIPKGTIVMTNMDAVHLDESYFPDPTRFQPERFLDSVTGSPTKTEGLLPFSMGKRHCPGENLARMELYLAITTLLFKYRLEVPEASPLPSVEPDFGWTLAPQQYRVKLVKRRL